MSILAAFLIAVLISALFYPGYSNRGSYMPILIFFIVLFLSGIATQYWIVPFGPVVWGISWLPLLFVVVLISFLFAAPSSYQRGSTAKAAGEVAAVAIGLFVWILIFMLLVAVFAGLLRS